LLFPLGQVVATRSVLEAIPNDAVVNALRRHARGDWGEVCEEDRGLNDEALKEGARLLSVYKAGESKFWIITEADRTATTVLLPEDY
jgi:hypothetical protein